MPVRARDLMQVNPITISANTPFLDVQHLFIEAQIGGAPVVDVRGVVCGIISSTDLLRVVDQVCDEDVDAPEQASLDSSELTERLDTLTALDVATPGAIWVLPDTPVSEVARCMLKEGVHRVLVGSDGRLLGILTAFDLLQAVQ